MGVIVTEQEIRQMVEGRPYDVQAVQDWYTPAGNRRETPMFIADIENEYLKKQRTIKARCQFEFENKVQSCIETWGEQEIKKRIIEAKKDKKEQSRAEAERLDEEGCPHRPGPDGLRGADGIGGPAVPHRRELGTPSGGSLGAGTPRGVGGRPRPVLE